MAASLAMLGYGSKFFIQSTNSPVDSPPLTYTQMAEVKNITPPNQQIDDVDVSHNESPQRRREFIAGLIDPGEASFEMNFVPGSASDVLIQSLLTSGSVRGCKITWTNGVNWLFNGIVKGYEISAGTEDAMQATVTFRTTGTVTAA